MTPDAQGNVKLVDRDTGKDHVCTGVTAREILLVATPAVDGAPRYIDKDLWDGKVAKAPADGKAPKGAKAAKDAPVVEPAVEPTVDPDNEPIVDPAAELQ